MSYTLKYTQTNCKNKRNKKKSSQQKQDNVIYKQSSVASYGYNNIKRMGDRQYLGT